MGLKHISYFLSILPLKSNESCVSLQQKFKFVGKSKFFKYKNHDKSFNWNSKYWHTASR